MKITLQLSNGRSPDEPLILRFRPHLWPSIWLNGSRLFSQHDEYQFDNDKGLLTVFVPMHDGDKLRVAQDTETYHFTYPFIGWRRLQ